MKQAQMVASVIVLLFGCVFVQAQQALATNTNVVVPPLVNFSGTLTEGNGNPLTGTVAVTFSLYSEQTGGAALWMESQNVQPDTTGHYTVMLGSTSSTGLPSEMFVAGQAHWLGVQVQGEQEQPRVLLVSAPYALKAGDAQTLGGLPASAFVLAAPPSTSSPSPDSTVGAATAVNNSVSSNASSDVTTTGGTVDAIPLFSTATNIQNSLLTQTGTSAINVGGKLILPAGGTATSTAGFNSRAQDFIASAYDSSTSAAVAQTFQWQAQAAGNDTSTPSGTLNLLFGSGTSTPTQTGLKIASTGLITFASGQTFPGTGDGTITGITTASGSGLTGGGTSGTLNLGLTTACATNQVLQWNGSKWACSAAGTGTITGVTAGTDLTGGGTSGNVTLNLDTTKIPQLNANNTFTGTQILTGTNSLGVLQVTNELTSGTAYGVVGQTLSPNGYGVLGKGPTTGGFGVTGITLGGTAVYGIDGAPSGFSVGVAGQSGSSGGTAVFGQEIATSGATAGVLGTASSSSGYGVEGSSPNTGVYGVATAASGATVGVYGTSSSSSGYGVEGVSTANVGVHGSSLGVSSTGQTFVDTSGVWGDVGNVDAVDGPWPAIYGTADDNYAGIFFNSTGSDTITPAVWATNFSGDPSAFVLVAGGNSGTASGYCVITTEGVISCNKYSADAEPVFQGTDGNLTGDVSIGDAGCGSAYWGLQLAQSGMSNCKNYTLLGDGLNTYINSGNGSSIGSISFRVNNATPSAMAVTPQGSVLVTNNLSVGGSLSVTGTKNFKIDHPLDPANKFLYHAAIESSEVLNQYSGNVTTDAQGEATVQLPDWFEAVNKDFRYQLTVVGQFAQAIIFRKVANHQFQIKTNAPNVEVSWQVTGVRNDAWEQAHPMVVEADKGADRGRYLTPELYGAPETARIGYDLPAPPPLPKDDSLAKRRAQIQAGLAARRRMMRPRPPMPVLPNLPPAPKPPAAPAKPQTAQASK